MITNGVASEYNYIMEKPMPQFGKEIYSTIRIPDDVVAQIRADAYEECARLIETSKRLFENHQTETIMVTKDKCIAMIRNLKEQNE